jgi:ADP-ribosyl-[dinitrogen reductase] hydrolase
MRGLVGEGRCRMALPSDMEAIAPAQTARPSRDRIEGMLLGLAIGDALGNTSESMTTANRMAAYGEIRDYLPNQYVEGCSIGLPSDDTQLAFWSIESMLTSGCVVPEGLAHAFSHKRIFGIGGTVLAFLAALKHGVPWDKAGEESAGNGALMRIAPLVLPSAAAGGEALIADLAIGAMVTHNDSASISSAVAFGLILRDLLYADSVPAPSWWVERYLAYARPFETAKAYRPRGGAFTAFEGRLSDFVESVVPPALVRGDGAREACDAWYSGAYLLETVPSVLYILATAAGDAEEAVVRAVNDTRDNDTIAAIVGAAVGALHGKAALPERWIHTLTGRTGDADDGRVFELAKKAAERWGKAQD